MRTRMAARSDRSERFRKSDHLLHDPAANKLVTELQRSQRGSSLYVLDELTIGLHASDADRLLVQLQRLVNAGNIVVMIEHDMRAVAQADWVIDAGPGAGDVGGRVVVASSPGQVAGAPDNRTAPFLAQQLKRARE